MELLLTRKVTWRGPVAIAQERAVKDERECPWGKSDILYLLNWEHMLNIGYFPGLLTLPHLRVSTQPKFVFRL